MGWEDEQRSELTWWGDCANTYTEETKQTEYAVRMGLDAQEVNGHWPVYDLGGRSVLDIGGGPCSLLLKTVNRGRVTVVDPCPYPDWVSLRYWETGIDQLLRPGEELLSGGYDEVWIYNVLQHTEDPERIITNARAAAELIRIFEWVDIPPHEGHPHELKAELLNQWLGGVGTVEHMNTRHCVGTAYYGVFLT